MYRHTLFDAFLCLAKSLIAHQIIKDLVLNFSGSEEVVNLLAKLPTELLGQNIESINVAIKIFNYFIKVDIPRYVLYDHVSNSALGQEIAASVVFAGRLSFENIQTKLKRPFIGMQKTVLSVDITLRSRAGSSIARKDSTCVFQGTTYTRAHAHERRRSVVSWYVYRRPKELRRSLTERYRTSG